MAELEFEAARKKNCEYLFSEAAFRYLEDVASKPSAKTIAMHLDQMFPFIGDLFLEKVHDSTL